MHDKAKVKKLGKRRIEHLLGTMYHRSKMEDNIDNRQIGTRQRDKVRFKVLFPNIKKAFRSPNYLGAKLWDKLPTETQLSGSYSTFKNRVNRHITAGLFDQM